MEEEPPEATSSDNDDFWDYYTEVYDVRFPEKDIAQLIYIYGCPVFLLIGTITNLISIIRFISMCQKVLSTILYLLVVCIMDLVVLYSRCGNLWFLNLFQYNFEEASMHWSNTVCKIYPFLSNFAYHLSVWLIVAMAIETTLVAFRPHRLLKIYSLERARAVFILIIVLLVCINAHCFWTYALIKVDKTSKSSEEICYSPKQINVLDKQNGLKIMGSEDEEDSDNFRKITWPIIDIILGDLLPYIVIFACTVMLITRRVQGHDRSRDTDIIWRSYPCDTAAAKDFHVTIIALSLFYLVLMLPKLVCDIFSFLVTPQGLHFVQYSFIFESKRLLAEAICTTCHYLFISAKFVIYVIFSREYRRGIKVMVTCHQCVDNGSQQKKRRQGALVKNNGATPLNTYNHEGTPLNTYNHDGTPLNTYNHDGTSSHMYNHDGTSSHTYNHDETSAHTYNHDGTSAHTYNHEGTSLNTHNINCNHNSEETNSLVHEKPYSITAV